VFPIRPDIEESDIPYELPIKVTDIEPEAGTFARTLEDINGASNVKTNETEDDKMAAVTATKFDGIFPRGLLHKILESEVHCKATNDVRERRALIVVANGPKFEPKIVTLTEDERGRFVISTELTKGVAYVNAFNSDPIWDAAVTWNELDLPMPEDIEIPEDVSEVHRK
jgi:hypothetical protein